MTEPCPTAETLAAYGDGKLTADERLQVEAHLAGCDDCFEQLAGYAAFRREEQAAGRVVAFPTRRRGRRWWSVAAASVAAMGLWVVLRPLTTELPGVEVLALAEGLGGPAELRAAAARSWNDDGGGLGFGGGPSASRRAFRLGVHLLDAKVALAAGDRAAWNVALERVAALAPRREATPLLERLRRVAPDGGEASADGSADFDRLARVARAVDAAAFDLGAWAEAGRLAALGGRSLLLTSGIAARFDEMAATPAAAEPSAARQFEVIRTALADRQVSPGELDALERSFERVILLH